MASGSSQPAMEATQATISMRNFPKAWMTPTAIAEIETKIEKLLATFGKMLGKVQVDRTSSPVTAKATFTAERMAQAAVKALHGVDMRTAREKREAGARPATEDEKFFAQIAEPEKAAAAAASETGLTDGPEVDYLLVEGFPKSWTDAQLRMICLAFGGVSNLVYVPDERYGRVARVELKDTTKMQQAVEQLHGSKVGDGDVIEECALACKIWNAALQRKEEEVKAKKARKQQRADTRKRRESRKEKERLLKEEKAKEEADEPLKFKEEESDQEEKAAMLLEEEEKLAEKERLEKEEAAAKAAKEAQGKAYQAELQERMRQAREKKEQEELKRQEKRRLWEEERLRKAEEKRQKEEARKKAEEEEKQRRIQQEIERRKELERKREEERLRKEEKMRKYEESRMRREEIRTRNAMQRRQWEEDCMRREEKLTRWVMEMEQKAAEKKRRHEEEKKRLEEERKLKHEEQMRQWEEKRMRREEEMQRRMEKAIQAAAERKRQKEEERKRQREEERKKREEELRRYEESRMRREEEVQRWLEKVKLAQEAAEEKRKLREEERKRKEDKMRRWEEDRMWREEMRQRHYEKKRWRDEERQKLAKDGSKRPRTDDWQEADVHNWATGEEDNRKHPSTRPKAKGRPKVSAAPRLDEDDETELDRLMSNLADPEAVHAASKASARPKQRARASGGSAAEAARVNQGGCAPDEDFAAFHAEHLKQEREAEKHQRLLEQQAHDEAKRFEAIYEAESVQRQQLEAKLVPQGDDGTDTEPPSGCDTEPTSEDEAKRREPVPSARPKQRAKPSGSAHDSDEMEQASATSGHDTKRRKTDSDDERSRVPMARPKQRARAADSAPVISAVAIRKFCSDTWGADWFDVEDRVKSARKKVAEALLGSEERVDAATRSLSGLPSHIWLAHVGATLHDGDSGQNQPRHRSRYEDAQG